MVEEVLVRETLSAQEIACGEELLRRIENAGIKVAAAYWVRDRTAEISSWTLDVVSSEVDKEGPLSFYKKIQKLISSPTRISCGLDLNMIEVLGLDYSFFKQLKSAIRSKTSLTSVPLSQLVVGNTLVDLFIYRFPATNGRHK
jgi:hypothetical protein